MPREFRRRRIRAAFSVVLRRHDIHSTPIRHMDACSCPTGVPLLTAVHIFCLLHVFVSLDIPTSRSFSPFILVITA